MSIGSIPKILIPKVLPETGPEAGRSKMTLRPSTGLFPAILSLFAALAFAGSVLLWAHYGTTVFFETIRAGFTACFG
jgi:hypothetical protein